VNGFREEVARLVDECQKDQATDAAVPFLIVILMVFFTKTRGTMNFSAVEMMVYPRLTIKNVGLANKKVSTICRETFYGI
jgi:hypothetical protein